ncbi:hypothetical protein DYB37_013880 [Aphanomyces astaci]|uniref:Peptidase A2 domain-containing protein n=1 Tax=Aphanomyces astaci TaxID=112090 RepID=A0A3R6Y8R8_APHAT|nr:hypothetical protein DYB35_012820 [Aphanomyces astaci]RHZ05029.1 hypothetical protein DYB37_013880 [Aphanomyces astaci]
MVKVLKPLGLQKSIQRQQALQRNKPLKTNAYRFVDWLRVHTAEYHLYAPMKGEKPSATPATAAALSSRLSKPGRSEGNGGHRSGPTWRSSDSEQDRTNARNKKVTKLQGSANKSLGCEAKIEGIVSIMMTLLDTGSDVTLVTAGVMQSLGRAGVKVKVISLEPSVIQPYGQAPVSWGRIRTFQVSRSDSGFQGPRLSISLPLLLS